MAAEHIKIYTGTSIITRRLSSILEENNIGSIIKDEMESALMAGFGAPSNSSHLFILDSDIEKAKEIVEDFKKEIA
ncbi:MAG: DUF2007 domain-containing protein [Flavobacteriaceae bacterium]